MLTEKKTKRMEIMENHNPAKFERQDSAQLRAGFSGNKPAKLKNGPLRFVITDSPSDKNLLSYVKEMEKLKVKHVCRASDPTYSTQPLRKIGVEVHEMAYADGSPPPQAVLDKWLNMVEDCFIKPMSLKKVRRVSTIKPLKDNEWVAVQCVAGLGRGPLLVAVALVEYCGLSASEAVNYIRKERRGAINEEQRKWLEKYSPARKPSVVHCKCVIC